MLARVTYVLVGVAAITLILGFFLSESNILLFVSIGLSLAAIVLIIVGATRRAREAPADVGAEAFDEFDEEEEEIPEDILSAFDEEDLEPEYDEDEEELEEYEDEFEDLEPEYEDEEELEEEEEEEEEPVRAAATKTRAKKKSAKKKTAKKKTAAKKSTAKRKANTVLAVEGRDRYHAPDCRFVRDKDSEDLEELTTTSAKRRGYEPCSVCSPD